MYVYNKDTLNASLTRLGHVGGFEIRRTGRGPFGIGA